MPGYRPYTLGVFLEAAPGGVAVGGAFYDRKRDWYGEMSVEITVNESNASLRVVPLWLVGSNGTTPATGESGATFMFEVGGAFYGSGGSLSLVSSTAGQYVAVFSASKLSVLGPGVVMYQSATALPASTPFRVVRTNSYNSQDMGLAAFSEVSIHAGTHSSVTIKGVENFANISNVTLHAGIHSNVTIQGVTRVNSNVTIADAEYSAVTVRLGLVNYSGATVGAGNLAAGNYSGLTVGVGNILQSVRSEIADDLLRRSIAAGAPGTSRAVQDALRPLRNRVLFGASVMTVYSEDDATSAWTASFTTDSAAVPLTGLNPAGGSA